MLVPAIVGNTNSLISARQVVASSAVIGAILYTVPAGKKFVGTIHSDSVGCYVTITPSGGAGVSVASPSIFSSYVSVSPIPVTLISGTIISNNSSAGSTFLVGVESDL